MKTHTHSESEFPPGYKSTSFKKQKERKLFLKIWFLVIGIFSFYNKIKKKTFTLETLLCYSSPKPDALTIPLSNLHKSQS